VTRPVVGVVELPTGIIRKGGTAHRLLRVLRQAVLTRDELRQRLGVQETTLRAAFQALRDAGLTILTDRGGDCRAKAVYRLVEDVTENAG